MSKKERYEVKIRVYKKRVSPQMNWRQSVHVGNVTLNLERGEKIVSYHFNWDQGELYVVTQTSPRVKDLEHI